MAGVGPDPDRSRESVGCTLGISLGLLLLAGLLAMVVPRCSRPFHSDELLADVFGGGLPAGFAVAEAGRRIGGEEIVRLTRADAPAGSPSEIAVVRFRSADGVERLFRADGGGGGGGGPGSDEGGGDAGRAASQRLQQWKRSPTFAWKTTIAAGDVAFGAWQSDYVIERSFREGGSWQDSAWVNLARPARHVALFALWPDEVEGTKETLRKVLASVRLQDPKAAAAR